VATLVAPFEGGAVRIRVEREAGDGGPPPMLLRSPEIRQGLGNLIENAVEFARREVVIRLGWRAGEVRIQIADDGPGFPAQLRSLLGEPYVTSRRERGGMGLGVFISKTLLERTGASLSFGNRRRGRGAIVEIVWPRGLIDQHPLRDAKAGRRGRG
jgi:two-component system sensor histidine kinase RegB